MQESFKGEESASEAQSSPRHLQNFIRRELMDFASLFLEFSKAALTLKGAVGCREDECFSSKISILIL